MYSLSYVIALSSLASTTSHNQLEALSDRDLLGRGRSCILSECRAVQSTQQGLSIDAAERKKEERKKELESYIFQVL